MLSHLMSHVILSFTLMQPVINYFIFKCFVTSTMSCYWLKHWSATFSFFHGKTFPPCASRSMTKNCRVLGYFFRSRSLCRVTIYLVQNAQIVAFTRKTIPPCALKLMMKNCRALGYYASMRAVGVPNIGDATISFSFSFLKMWAW